MSTGHSSARGVVGGMDHPDCRARLGSGELAAGRARDLRRLGGILAIVLTLGLLSVGCAPELRVEAHQVAAEVAVQEAGAAAPEPAADEAAAAPADTEQTAALEGASTPLPGPEPSEVRPSLPDRSGLRGADEAPAAEAAPLVEKLANVQALVAARPTPPIATLTTETALQAAPTPKPATRVAVRAPRPVVSSGGWIELPNVRPIPSTYYSAVHQWDSIVNHWAAYYRIDPDLIRRIIYVESKGYQYAYNSSTGVKGLMQITPSWFKAGENPYDPWTNVGKGAYILRRGYDVYHTWFLAVTWYCYGPLARYGGNVPTMYAGLIYSPIIRSL